MDSNDTLRPGMSSLFLQFLKLGFIAFGGPAAHASLMERELVSRKKWISAQTFLDFLGAVNLIPGPNSTQLTMLTGYRLGGIPGMLVSGIGFIVPAALITGIFAWFYVSMGQVPAIESFFFGLKPAVIAVIAGAVFKLGKKALRNKWLGILGLIAIAAMLSGLSEILTILGAGALGMLAFTLFKAFNRHQDKNKPDDSTTKGASAIQDSPHNKTKNGEKKRMHSFSPLLILNAGLTGVATITSLKLFWVFFKIGAVLFGSGYLLVAYMDGELVERLAWLTREQLLDAIAIGQFTPGPILSAATFVGYLLNGVPGAIAATIGIFLPSIVFIIILYPIIPRLRKSVYSAAFLDSVNVAAVAVMLAVSISMAIEIAVDWQSIAILMVALGGVFLLKKISSAWIILGGAALGFVVQYIS